jgi:HEPN domain-containing protein
MNDNTQEAVRQWLARARADWETVNVLIGNADSPHESIAFHCQQYVEKLLKAFLTMQGIEAPRTHDVRRLVQLAAPVAPEST